ncbi:DUF2384 domain-containing protein [Collimonas humicola]|uniref:DUF2384 domain-containing protein n=1 Tax=Collimonas humicola TaxID=2825886 RepID=UPI001B8B31F2|nr:DUF2384 domain-containing protein [Collimonas humicola]
MPNISFSPEILNDFDGLIDYLRDPMQGMLALSPKRFADVLGINLQTLAVQAHVHRNTVSRSPRSESVQRFLREALRILRAAFDHCGDIQQTIFWYRNAPLADFQYRTAEQLLVDGYSQDVVDYIERIELNRADMCLY